MNNKEFAKKLEERTLQFGVAILKFSARIPYSLESKVVRNQLSKSGTSVGANYYEANRARSKADFSNKIKISESEANETVYWLRIVNAMEWSNKENLALLLKEAKELLSIFAAIGRSL